MMSIVQLHDCNLHLCRGATCKQVNNVMSMLKCKSFESTIIRLHDIKDNIFQHFAMCSNCNALPKVKPKQPART